MIRKREGVGVGKWEVEGKECKQHLTSTVQYDCTLHDSLLPFSLFIQSISPFLIGSHSTANSSDSVDQILKTFVVVNFLPRVIFLSLLFLGMVMYVNEVETKKN